ncbi:hypothetical protein [Christensenella hongkongensis]|uniref:hypothetical protein n=1 Tax=Christensenella hongkongensis TaxID=270498 RepID=UPI0038B2BCF7
MSFIPAASQGSLPAKPDILQQAVNLGPVKLRFAAFAKNRRKPFEPDPVAAGGF